MFFALPEFSTSAWKIVNATYWIAKFFTHQLIQESPDYLIFIRDAKGKNFRHEIYEDYKATRDRMPDNLREQLQDINTMVETMGLKVIEESGYEADDIIGTMAKKYSKDYEIYILTGDKDLYALVNEKVKIYDTLKKKIFWLKETKEKFEIEACFVSDYLAIVGDTSDNIPWISWIWPKKAVVLINDFWSLENIYEAIDKLDAWEILEMSEEIKKTLSGKTWEKIREGKEIAFLSKRLATLDTSVDLSHFHLDDFVFHRDKIFSPEVKKLFKEFEFYSLIEWEKNEDVQKWENLWLTVKIVGDDEWLKILEEKMKNYEEIILDTETTSLNTMQAELVWVSIFLDEDHIFYINFLHHGQKVSKREGKEFLKKLLESDKKIIGHNLKYDLEIIENFLSFVSEKEVKEKKTQTSLF
jgi:DNA polymerase I